MVHNTASVRQKACLEFIGICDAALFDGEDIHPKVCKRIWDGKIFFGVRDSISASLQELSREFTLARKVRASKMPALPSDEKETTLPYHSTHMSTATLQNNIRRLRFERNMTQEELALRVGVSRQTIMSIERGATNPSVLLAYKIGMALQVPVTEVFQVEGTLVPV